MNSISLNYLKLKEELEYRVFPLRKATPIFSIPPQLRNIRRRIKQDLFLALYGWHTPDSFAGFTVDFFISKN